MIFASAKSLEIPEGIVTKITDENGLILWQEEVVPTGPTNQVPISTESDGVTIYNGGLGYKNGYRIRSGGAEGEASTASHTGFIPVKPGDVVRISGFIFSSATSENAVNVYDSSFTNLGQMTPSYAAAGYGIFAASGAWVAYSWSSVEEESSGVWKWVVPPVESGVAYIRVTGLTQGDGSVMLVTVNEEIT